MAKLAEEMTADYMRNIEAMGVDTIDHFPRCTATMPEIIQFTQDLIDKGFAYEAKGDVYFDVDQGQGLRQTQPPRTRNHARRRRRHGRSQAKFRRFRTLEIGQGRASRPGTALGGQGRPGWHIECSAMSKENPR